jgi:Beta-lactamase superfamily domain
LTRAYHSSAEIEKWLRAVRGEDVSKLPDSGVAIPLGHPNGIVVRAKGEPTIYHMGDTDIFSDMSLIAELYRPDIVMVPIGDRFTMGAESAALAVHRFVRPKIVIPCHYGSFPIIAPNADRFVELVASHGDHVRVVVPKVGEAYTPCRGGLRMARLARVVVPGLPHRVTQRGDGRARTFFCDGVTHRLLKPNSNSEIPRNSGDSALNHC